MNMTPFVTVFDSRLNDAEAESAQYICHRVIDTLLRENVRECVNCSTLMPSAMLPAWLGKYAQLAHLWLKINHFGDGCLWIPVIKTTFMQDWRSAGLPLLWRQDGQVQALYAVEAIIACFARGLPSAGALSFTAFSEECQVAAKQHVICAAERKRWFAEFRALHGVTTAGTRLVDWHARLLHYDRLGAFLDHPFYPTARAKLGFDTAALTAYGPEFQQHFLLCWLAVPHAFFRPNAGNEQRLPRLWPSFDAVGLPDAMRSTHVLIPIHPFVWRQQLDDLLDTAGLHAAIRAPRPYLAVAPTLSVRTVVLLDAPEWHLKLPLTIRTLGAKNIRTIKPSTIPDGHSIQTLLSHIVVGEPSVADRLLLTNEACGAHVDNQMALGYILRRYPVETLRESTLIPVAALLAQTPAGNTVAEEIAAQFYAGKLENFLNDYLDLTLRFHLVLWLRYGIALESNQQNSIVVLSQEEPRLRLLLKDNDAARIHLDSLTRRWPHLAAHVAELRDQRIVVTDPLALAQMFTTITLQLNIAVLVERLATILALSATTLYSRIRLRIDTLLEELAAKGEDIGLARRILLEDERLPIKYLLIAATLAEKKDTGATDVNKFYGHSAPNFLKVK